METTILPTRKPRLSRDVKTIKFSNHYETWHSEKTDPKKQLKIQGRHVDENGIIRDQKNYIVVATSNDLVKKGHLINTSVGVGKSYEVLQKPKNTVSIFTNW